MLSSQIEVERMSAKIEEHFSKERSLIQTINDISLKLDKAAFKLLKIQMEHKKSKEKITVRSPRSDRSDKEGEKVKNTIE
jgi:hypothetical protein